MKRFFSISCFLLLSFTGFSQEIAAGSNEKKLRLSSSVELRTWKLDTRVDMKEEPLSGASIVLLKGSEVVHKSATNITGGFEVLVPLDGEFILEVSYKGCNTKRFYVSTLGIPPDVKTADYFKPTFSIGGFVMAKAFPGIDYSGLQQSLVKVVYTPKIKNFDDDEAYTEGVGKEIVSKIANAEDVLTQKFCATNRAGDAALAKPDCPLAKKLYNEAIALIPGEQYPVEQLKKVGDCLKALEEEQKKKDEAAAAKAEKEKAAAEKAAAEKQAKEEAAKLAAEKAAEDKKAKDEAAKAAADKASADKLAREQAAKDKAAAEKEARDKKAADKAASDKLAKDKLAADKVEKDKIAKEKAIAQREEDDKKKTAAAKPNEPQPLSYETKAKDSEGAMDKRDSKHSVPQVLGANKYKDALNKAEGYFKMKRYAEAKTAYEDVLKIKPDDAYSKGKLEQIEKLMTK